MTLLVARIYDGDKIIFVSDTKVTWDLAPAVEDEFADSVAKIVLLRGDLAVGVAGYDPHGRIRDLIALRSEPVEDLIVALCDDTRAAFVVAALEPARLWTVAEGRAVERSEIGVAWEGDEEAYADFRARYETEWAKPPRPPVPFRMMTALQHLTSFRKVLSVGGFTIRAHGDPENGFQFIGDKTFVLGGASLSVMVGQAETPGAIGMYDQSRGLGLLFRHESPDTAVQIVASNNREFGEVARDAFGQDLAP
jgi:hypothetical protein